MYALRVPAPTRSRRLVARGLGKRDESVDRALGGSVVDGARQEVESDQCVHLELPALELGEEISAASDEHRSRAKLGRNARRLARGLRPQKVKSRQPQQSASPFLVREAPICPRRYDLDGLGIWNRRKAGRAVARGLALFFSSQRLDDFLRGDRDLVDPNAERVVHGRADRGRDWKQRTLSSLLRAVRTLRIDRLDDEGLDFGHVEEGR